MGGGGVELFGVVKGGTIFEGVQWVKGGGAHNFLRVTEGGPDFFPQNGDINFSRLWRNFLLR